jgi:hypothetical protein
MKLLFLSKMKCEKGRSGDGRTITTDNRQQAIDINARFTVSRLFDTSYNRHLNTNETPISAH